MWFARIRLHCWLIILAVGASTGCVSKSASRERAHKAFLEGQRTGAASAQSTLQTQSKSVMVVGEVRNPVVPWIEGLSLTQAIIAAQHAGPRSPRAVILRHGAESATFETGFVMQNGHTILLEPGDVIELVK